ncbi:MAG: polysulfide reductase NrfD [Chloroflexi bacterium]|nr:polysulfide reductase NrfD [Chloroflexota bacterium]
MSPETQAPGWEWYFVAMYFFVAGTSAGAYFIGSLVELIGSERQREISRVAYYIAFPLILLTPPLLILDLGRPERFWHLFFYVNGGIPYINLQSPLSVGSWALVVFGAMSFLSFLDNLIQDGRLKFAPFANLYNRRPRKLYALIGSLAGFFIAGYTGVLLNTTTRPLWAATDPLLGFLFIVSGASTGAAAIALVMAARRVVSPEALERLESFDRFAMIVELVLIAALVVIAGQFAAPLFTGIYALLFWGGTVLLGILIPFGLSWYAARGDLAGRSTVVVLAAVLILLGGALLRISLVTAGQV